MIKSNLCYWRRTKPVSPIFFMNSLIMHSSFQFSLKIVGNHMKKGSVAANIGSRNRFLFITRILLNWKKANGRPEAFARNAQILHCMVHTTQEMEHFSWFHYRLLHTFISISDCFLWGKCIVKENQEGTICLCHCTSSSDSLWLSLQWHV